MFVFKKTVCVLLFGALLFSGFPVLAAGKIDINKATVEQLVEINGVGDVLAKRIVDYRTQHKKFKTLDELQNVKGIGVKSLEKLRPHLMLVKK